MSRLISDILNAPEPHFSHTIQEWESKSGRPGHDLRFMSDVSQKKRSAIKQLKLDENDTRPRELYYALLKKGAESNDELEKVVDVQQSDSPEELIEKIIAFINTFDLKREVWVIKHTVVKQLLLNQPPKKLLKIFGLRSIDSVLKRTNAFEFLCLAYQVESSDWKKKIHSKIKQLNPTDFQARHSSIYVLEKNKADKLHKIGYNNSNLIVPSFETGTILIVPPAQRFPLDTIALAVGTLQALHDMRTYSAYFKYISVKSDFGSGVVTALSHGLPGKIGDKYIGWRPFVNHLHKSSEVLVGHDHPNLHPEDVVQQRPVHLLAEKLPQLSFWADNHAVLIYEPGQLVSLNLIDVLTNASNQLPYENRTYAHLQNKIWEELGMRYLQHASVEADAKENLDRTDSRLAGKN